MTIRFISFKSRALITGNQFKSVCALRTTRRCFSLTAYRPVIGLELHAQLASSQKLFSRAPVRPNRTTVEEPNQHVALLDLAYPGSLPVLNKEAVLMAVKLGTAIGSQIPFECRFDRKHYFYHDIPAGYQITQKFHPIARGGTILLSSLDDIELQDKRIRIEQIQLEQDTAKTLPDPLTHTLRIDYNRSGVALVEIVTMPDFNTGKEAAIFVKKMTAILRTLGVSEANMDEGSLRVDVNVSVSRNGEPGTRVELKNLASIKSIQAAIDYEIKRHTAIYENCETSLAHYDSMDRKLESSTRSFDPQSQKTRHLRLKSTNTDYRYFPDPNIPAVHIFQEFVDQIQAGLPILPDARRQELLDLGVRHDEVRRLIEHDSESYFEDCMSAPILREFIKNTTYKRQPQHVANWIINTLFGELSMAQEKHPSVKLAHGDHVVSAQELAALVDITESGVIAHHQSRKFLRNHLDSVFTSTEKPGVERPADLIVSLKKAVNELQQLPVEELQAQLHQIMDKNTKAMKDILVAQKHQAINFLAGQFMRAVKGRASSDTIHMILGQALKDKGISNHVWERWADQAKSKTK